MDSHTEARADIIREFLEVSIHAILFTRGIYPHALFEPRRKYNIPVKMCRHPELNQYINNSLHTVHSLLLQNAVEKVEMLLVSTDKAPLDCYCFSLPNYTLLQESSNEDTYLVELEDSMRAALLKINISDTISQTVLPEGTTFMIQVHTNKRAAAQLHHDQEVQGFPWVEVDSVIAESSSSDSTMTHQCIPLKVVDAGWLKIVIQMKTGGSIISS